MDVLQLRKNGADPPSRSIAIGCARRMITGEACRSGMPLILLLC